MFYNFSIYDIKEKQVNLEKLQTEINNVLGVVECINLFNDYFTIKTNRELNVNEYDIIKDIIYKHKVSQNFYELCESIDFDIKSIDILNDVLIKEYNICCLLDEIYFKISNSNVGIKIVIDDEIFYKSNSLERCISIFFDINCSRNELLSETDFKIKFNNIFVNNNIKIIFFSSNIERVELKQFYIKYFV